MRRFRRTTTPLPRRGPKPWTPLEILLIIISLALIVFPLYAEGYRLINPAPAPAAPRSISTEPAVASTPPEAPQAEPQQGRNTITPLPETPVPPTTVPPPTTETATTAPPPPTTETAATVLPTETPAVTVVPPTDTIVPTPGPPTNTPPPGATTAAPTDTPAASATVAPTDTPPPGATTAAPTDTPPPGATTAVPTDTPAASATVAPPTGTPTPFAGEPPLAIEKVASVANAGIGQEFSYSISVFTSSDTPRPVEVRDRIDSSLEVRSATPSNGSCSTGATVTCKVTVQRGQPAAITINVRVRSDAAPGRSITNQALAQDDANNTASSDQVTVEISGEGPVPPGSPRPTSPPGGGPTNTPVTNPTRSPAPQPTNTPKPREEKPRQGGGDEGKEEDRQKPTEVPLPPLPPTARPGAAAPGLPPLPPTARPARPVQRPPARATATQAPQAPATAVPPTITPTPDAGIFFRMASDWGSRYPGETVNYVIAVLNTEPAGGRALENLFISSELPTNLEILGAQSARFAPDNTRTAGKDPDVARNRLSLSVDALQPGERTEVTIQTKIRPTTEIGTRIVTQASLTYQGLTIPAYSNVVTVLVVGNAPVQAAAQQASPTAASPYPAPATATAPPTNTPTAQPTPTWTATPTTAATAQPPSPTPAGNGRPIATTAPVTPTTALPAGSAGIPFSGILLLGMTLMVRTIRLHRAKMRL